MKSELEHVKDIFGLAWDQNCSMKGSYNSFLTILPKEVPRFAKAVLSPSEKLVAHQQWVCYIYCAPAWKSELGPASQRQGIEMGGWVLVLAYSSETRGWEAWSSQIWSHPLSLPPRRTIPRISNNLKYCEKSPHIGQWGIFKYFGQYFDLSLTCSVEAQLQSHFPTESFPFLHCVSFRGLAMAGPGKRRCYGCIQARSSLPARFLILKAGQELRQELDLSLFPETDLTSLRKYCICLLHWYVYLYMVTGHYQLLMSRVSSRSGDASSEFPTSHTFAHMCNANGALMSTDLRHVRVGEEYLYMRESLMFHVCGYWLSLLMGRALSYIQYIIHVYVLYMHYTYTLTPFFHVFMPNILHLHTLHCKVGMANMKQTNCFQLNITRGHSRPPLTTVSK